MAPVLYPEEPPPGPRPSLTRCLREVRKPVIHEMTASGMRYCTHFEISFFSLLILENPVLNFDVLKKDAIKSKKWCDL